eukprot:TRINITY_DN9872_c0_g1_i11.p1 TRINITY_DN9872_c0_g1~~TRINITY_DN9872_c0_g1_i11.p1  ORF type:complete len:291 (-),score=78.85 TRINITY_DN9872_c0_g1_i11:39-911(-)
MMSCEDSAEYKEGGDDLDKQIEKADNKKLKEVKMSVVSDIVNGRLHFLFKLVGFVTACFLVFYLMYLLKDYVHAVLLWAENQPPWAVVFIFIALFTLVSLPLAWGYIVVNLACGYLFGALYGLLVTVFTATIGILIAHIISKHFLSSHISGLLNKTDYIRALYSVISGPQAFKVVVLARLTPVPFGLQNAIFSASSLPTQRYLVASVLGLLPTQSCNAYIGSTLRSMEEVLTNSDAVRTGWMILLAQLFVSILVAMFIIKKARMELDKILLVKKCQIISESDLNLVVCEK